MISSSFPLENGSVAQNYLSSSYRFFSVELYVFHGEKNHRNLNLINGKEKVMCFSFSALNVSSMISTRSVLWWYKRLREIPCIIMQGAAERCAPCCHGGNVAQNPQCCPHRMFLMKDEVTSFSWIYVMSILWI